MGIKEQKQKHFKRYSGFSLVEFLIVLCIISISMSVAAVHYQKYLVQAEIGSALGDADSVKKELLEYYYLVGRWPKDDKQLRDQTRIFSSLLDSDWMQNSGFDRITVSMNGVINIRFSKYGRMQEYVDDPVLTLRPVLTKGQGPGVIFWLCGNANPPDNAVVLGKNRTNIPKKFLITNCKRN